MCVIREHANFKNVEHQQWIQLTKVTNLKREYPIKSHQSAEQVKNNNKFLWVLHIKLLSQPQKKHKHSRFCVLQRRQA